VLKQRPPSRSLIAPLFTFARGFLLTTLFLMMSEIFLTQGVGNKGFVHRLKARCYADTARRLLRRFDSFLRNLLKERRMHKENSSKGIDVLAAAMAVIRRVIHLPTALVDMMEKHGTEK
jgi:hypothetical protein